LEIAGTGLLEGSVRETAARDSRVKYLGFISGQEKAEALSRAHCLLLPSLWYENAPVVIAEAISKGVGVVASDIGGIPEFVAQNRTGFLFPPGDSVALAELMLRLVRDRTLLTDCADHTRLVAPGHNVERMIGEYETHYTALVYPTSVFQAAE
jgi:glycosyltransferase involved in cell wall biosynthesis